MSEFKKAPLQTISERAEEASVSMRR